jgi:glycosyltransferase involved in cell wall biosynthesis
LATASNNQNPLISVIIPCRNEEKYIALCLDTIMANDYPREKIEVFVVDGMSTDATRSILREYGKKHDSVKVFDNPKKILAAAWNIGIRSAKGDIIMCLNAHALFMPDYISKCVNYLREYQADYVGGIIETLPRGGSFIEKSISLVLSSPFGVGNSYFRIGANKPIWADTAAFGGYKREVFEKVGLYNEELTRSQDMEFHLRLKKIGARILLAPDMRCKYYIRSDFKNFLRDSFVNGFWTIYPLRYNRIAISLRHLIPLFFVLSLISSLILSLRARVFLLAFVFILGLYALVSICFSVSVAIKKKDLLLILFMPIVFAILHLQYGLGTSYAAIKVLLSPGFWAGLLSNKDVGPER